MADEENFNPGISLAGAVDLSSVAHQVKAAPGEAGGAPKAGKYVMDVTESSFQAMVETTQTFPVLLLLWVSTDDRLFAMAKRIGDAVNGLEGKIALARIDVEQFPALGQAFRVQGVPALFGLIAGRPMPVMQGIPSADELDQIVDQVIPQIIELAQKSGVTGLAPMSGPVDDDSEDASSDADALDEVPQSHQAAYALAQAGEYAKAAIEYKKLVDADSGDKLAVREYAKSNLLARSGNADIRKVRQAAADSPDDLEAQLAVADVDMIGGQVADAFARLLDFARIHRDELDAVRERLVEYFQVVGEADARVKDARRRLAVVLY
jgi:putative thioredoxin